MKTSPKAFDGFTMELAKLAVDFSEHVSANLKVCYGCHGFEADMMYFDVRVADELNFRIGRFSPSFGAFNPARSGQSSPQRQAAPVRHGTACCVCGSGTSASCRAPFPDNGSGSTARAPAIRCSA